MTRVGSVAPSVGWLRAYKRRWLSHDVVGWLAAIRAYREQHVAKRLDLGAEGHRFRD